MLLTRAYLKRRFQELKTTMAIMQAVNTRTRRFIPIQREQLQHTAATSRRSLESTCRRSAR